ncbi:hypothetical protein [Mesorhizobium sp.]|uniref:hypothetical protein n=1 Tax=Mesorhizobium sp. TaxID=1871066 RepID=UPI000FEA89CD|nr:hypothetical protein [Mesorhizobium sp.]RWP49513.1 MAG: hypothetical protein EOR05_10050 [Mesorhizobium sp.]
MDSMHLRVFQGQVYLQCRFMLRAADDLNRALKSGDPEHVFYALQNLLNAGANISKAFWGGKGKKAAERKLLRDSIGISDDSPLRDVAMRNNFEHIDERIDRWWENSPAHDYVDINIGDVGGVAQQDMFRNYNMDTQKLTFWGEDFDVQGIVDEVLRILPMLKEKIEPQCSF